MLGVLKRIFENYGDDFFHNMHRTNAILLDLAPGLNRERILVRSFIEIDGYRTLKSAGQIPAYTLVEKRLTQTLAETFSMERAAAMWVVRLFAMVLGLLPEAEIPLAFGEETPMPGGALFFSKPYIHGQIAMGMAHAAAVSVDGTVFAGGANRDFQCDVSGWRDIVAVAAGDAHTLGLRANGTVLAAGSNAYDQCDVSHLTGVKAIYAFGYDSVCVLADGTCVAVGGSKWDVSDFTDISSVALYPEGVVGIKTDGTLAITGYTGEDESNLEKEWMLNQKDAAQIITTYMEGIILLSKDGRLYKSNQPGNYFAQWRDIRAITGVRDGFAALSSDGTVRVLPFDRSKPRIATEADDWRDITAICGGYKRLMGLTRDGRVLAATTDVGWLWGNKAMAMDYVNSWYPVGAAHD